MKKKIIILLIAILFLPTNVVKANEKVMVKFNSCIDGDTANFILKKKKIKVRFLAIDTPEIKHGNRKADYYGEEAKEYTCNKLKKASKIELEFDINSDKKDKYNRYLAWVFVDNKLLQEELVGNGYAKIKYLYGDYKYTNKLKKLEKNAQNNNIGIWTNDKFDLKQFIIGLNIYYKILLTILLIIIISIYLYIDKKARRKALRKGKKQINKLIKKKVK